MLHALTREFPLNRTNVWISPHSNVHQNAALQRADNWIRIVFSSHECSFQQLIRWTQHDLHMYVMYIYIVCGPINWTTIIKNHHDFSLIRDWYTDWYWIYIINAFIYAKIHIEWQTHIEHNIRHTRHDTTNNVNGKIFQKKFHYQYGIVFFSIEKLSYKVRLTCFSKNSFIFSTQAQV